MEEPEGSHRTRSRAAPDWNVEESLILLNEISAVESEWGATLPSFQKWQQIVENCNALDVNRNLNQCKRKWDALLSEYRRAKLDAAAEGSLPVELYRAIDACVSGRGRKDSGDEAEEMDEEIAAEVEEPLVMETDPDSDPEAQGRVNEFFLGTGSKKQKRRMKRQKRRLETRNPWGYYTCPNIKREESNSMNENLDTTMNVVESSVPEENNTETQEQIMAKMLWENASQINAILEGNIADDDLDYKLADLKNDEAVQTDFTRRQGDKLIDCLGNISATLNQLCDFVQQCK